MRKTIYLALILGGVLFSSCSKEFTVNDQNDYFSGDKIETLSVNPEAALRFSQGIESGAYNAMRKSGVSEAGGHEDFGQKAVDIIMDAMSSDMVFGNMNWFSYHYTMQDRLSNGATNIPFNYYSKLAHFANLTMQSLIKNNPTGYKESVVYGRVLALRAFANYNLVRMFGYDGRGISFETVSANGTLSIEPKRYSVEEVNAFVESDLLESFAILEGYTTSDKSHITGDVVAGFLSRFYLYTEDFAKAKQYALTAMGGSVVVYSFDEVNEGTFSSLNNQDWMWGSYIDGSSTTVYASYFSHMDSFNAGYAGLGTSKSIDASLYDQMKPTDKRLQEWFSDGERLYTSPHWDEAATLGKYENTKFRDPSTFLGDYLFMRRTEMLFNYIEASIKLGNEQEAVQLLNKYLSTRDPKYYLVGSGEQLFKLFQIQKRIEFWGEGFALLDVKRWGTEVNRVYEGTNHHLPGALSNYGANAVEFTLQFPRAEMNVNDFLKPNNP